MVRGAGGSFLTTTVAFAEVGTPGSSSVAPALGAGRCLSTRWPPRWWAAIPSPTGSWISRCCQKASRACACTECGASPRPSWSKHRMTATVVAIRDLERTGIDIITDGEIRRESYSNRFATALDGVDVGNPGVIRNRNGQDIVVPRVVGRIQRTRAVEVRDMQFLRANTDRVAKITLPGPFTLAQQAQNDFYRDAEELAMDFAAAGQRRGARPPGRRGRRHPTRRALAPQRPRSGEALHRSRDQPGPRGDHRHHGAAPVLRVRRGHATAQADGAFVPPTRGDDRRADPDRGRAAPAGLGVLADLAGKTIVLGGHRPGRPRHRDRGAGGGAGSGPDWRGWRRNG